jgi:hypothetical protein
MCMFFEWLISVLLLKIHYQEGRVEIQLTGLSPPRCGCCISLPVFPSAYMSIFYGP